MSSLSEIVHALGARKAGSCWIALCPAHREKEGSLSLREGNDGRVLVHCFGGCSQEAVIRVLRNLGLWNGSGGFKAESQPISNKLSPIAEYFYRDEHGAVLYRVTRHEPMPQEKKPFRAWRPDGFGGWRMGLGGIKPVLYNLPQILTNEIVFIPEGEKDCDSLRDNGFVATTNPFGAGKWLHAFDPLFAGKTVVLSPDADEPGQDHIRDVAGGVLPYARQVILLEFDTKDISDWLVLHSEVELCDRLEVLLEGA